MPYTSYDSTKPTTASLGTSLPAETLANLNALRDAVIMGKVAGWTGSVVNGSGTAEEPQYKVWSNGVLRIRGTFTYSAGYVTAITWEYSSDSGSTPNGTGTWSTIASETTSYDGSKNTTGGNNSGLVSWLFEWIGKLKDLRTLYNAHAAATGASAHGLGTISTQGAGAVAITGGTINGTAVGGTTRAAGAFIYERETKVALGNVSGSIALDWATCGVVTATITAAGGAFTHANLPNGVVGYLTIDLTNGGVATSGSTLFAGVKWAGGTVPTFSASGRDIVTLFCHDGATVSGTMLKGMA